MTRKLCFVVLAKAKVRHARELGHPGSISGFNGQSLDSRFHGNDETPRRQLAPWIFNRGLESRDLKF
jgi:hypothetical protein